MPVRSTLPLDLFIVSGAQAGADRAGLDWAISRGLSYGGWCPKGRRSEDGASPTECAMQETPLSRYPIHPSSSKRQGRPRRLGQREEPSAVEASALQASNKRATSDSARRMDATMAWVTSPSLTAEFVRSTAEYRNAVSPNTRRFVGRFS